MMNWDVFSLFLVALLLVATLVACKVMLRRADRTLSLPMPTFPSDPDPYETAYLADGAGIVAEVMIVSLTQRGYLQKTRNMEEEESIQAASVHPGKDLSPAESELFHWFSEPRTGFEVFWGWKPGRLMKPHFSDCDKKLRGASLLSPQNVKNTGKVIWIVGSVAVGGFCWRIVDTFGAWLFLTGLLIALLAWICTPPHLSAHGGEYLNRLKGRFEKYEGSTLPEVSPILPLLVALFGVGVLDKTEYEWISELKSESEPADD